MTIHQLKDRCWVLDPNPQDDDDDRGIPHYDTHAKAEAALAEERDETNGDDEIAEKERARLAKVRVRQLAAVCWIAECDAPDGPDGTCLDTLGDDENGPSCIHFETAEDLIGWMPAESWARSGADGALCYVHGPLYPADRLVPASPPSPAELEDAGQMRLPGVA